MTHALTRQWFWLIEALVSVCLRSRNHSMGKGMVGEYQARLGIVKASAICRSLTRLRLIYRSPQGEPWPDEIKERLDTLEAAIIKVGLATNEQEDCVRVQNALIEWQSAHETFERYQLLVPLLLGEIKAALDKAHHELNPEQSHGHSL